MEHMNKHQGWRQGKYIRPIRRQVSKEEAAAHNEREQLLVRPWPKENAICQTVYPEDAAWIAKRLNRAAELEEVIEKVRKLLDKPPHYYDMAVEKAVDILKEAEK